jgi:hypothetical protein
LSLVIAMREHTVKTLKICRFCDDRCAAGMRTADGTVPDLREQKVAQPDEGGEGGVRGGLHHPAPRPPHQNHPHRVLLLQQESVQLGQVDARRHVGGAHRRNGGDFRVQRHEVHPKSAIV